MAGFEAGHCKIFQHRLQSDWALDLMAIAPISLGFHSDLKHLVLSLNPESTPLWVVGGRREVPCPPPWVVVT